MPASPTNVIAQPLGWKIAEGIINDFDVSLDTPPEGRGILIFGTDRGQVRVVDLNDKPASMIALYSVRIASPTAI